MKIPSVEKLAEAGLHFGHRKGKWHPSMKRFIYKTDNKVHIIDLEKTKEKLKQALEVIKKAGEEGQDVLLVGTKIRIGDIVEQVGEKYGLFYVANQWLGGMLTNLETIRKNIDRLKKMEEDIEKDRLSHYTKRERNEIENEIKEKNQIYGGIREMKDLPDLVVVLDAKLDNLAIREANKRDIPVVALTDTNIDISDIDYPVPGNDDALKAVELIAKLIGKAYQEGTKASDKKKNKKKNKKKKAKKKKDD